MEASTIVVRSLKSQGIEYIFGVVGIPVTPIAEEAQKEGIKFFGMRNEQAASYAASVVGYLTQKPACMLTVAGPGVVHALAGILNATANSWPLLVLSASGDSTQKGQGSFQESKQVEAAALYAKLAVRVEHTNRIPYHIEHAVRTTVYGQPGPAYVEIPADIINGKLSESELNTLKFPPHYPPPPKYLADPTEIDKAVALLREAKKPLAVLGEGAAYARAEDEVNKFIDATQLPVITSPMGKGLVPEDSKYVVAAARSLALAEADVILLVGAKLNWMFGYGQSPAFNKNVKIIQVDPTPDNANHNLHSVVNLCGTINLVLPQLLMSLQLTTSKNEEGTRKEKEKEEKDKQVLADFNGEWWTNLRKKAEENSKRLEAQCNDDKVPMGYHYVLTQIKSYLPRDAVIVNEGANTMDFGRLLIPNYAPRQRLDAGALSAMGLGVGYAIAAAAVHGDAHKVVAIEGDSAFGFAGMEVEVACRYNLPITFIVVNNNGIYRGIDELPTEGPIPSTAFIPNARYEKVMEAFGGIGYFVTNPGELKAALEDALVGPENKKRPSLINIMITPEGPIPKIVQREQKNEK